MYPQVVDARDESALAAIKLYYETGLSQAEVAKTLGVSRPTVSKLIQYGKERGFVTIEIHDPREQTSAVADRIKERYGLTDVRIAYPAANTDAEILHELGQTGAGLVESLVTDNMNVGVSWGNTMNAVAHSLRTTQVTGVKVVQLKGGHSHSSRTTNDMDTLTRFCHAFNAQAEYLPLPVIFDNAQAKAIVEQDRHIAHVLELGRTTDLCVFTAGDVSRTNLLLNLGYLNEDEIAKLLNTAVGDVCSRFYTLDGTVAMPSINDRTVGISLKDLAARPTRVLIAGGQSKALAIATALKMGLATHLVTDVVTGEKILQVA